MGMQPFGALLLLAVSTIASSGAVDAAQRTFVAVSGVDNAQCSIASPCRTFGGALAATDPQGEIIVLESGGYGRVTIGKSVAITAPPGVYAGISVFPGENGIDITASSATIVLRGLTINGHGGTHGINLTGASMLSVDRCIVTNMTGNGIRLLGPGFASISNTTVESSGDAGIFAGGQGESFFDNVSVRFNSGAGMHFDVIGIAFVSHALVEFNASNGLELATSTALGSFTLTVRDSTVRRNYGGGAGISIVATGGAHATANISGTAVSSSGSDGLRVDTDAASQSSVSFTGGYISQGFAGVTATGAGASTVSVAGTSLVALGVGLSQSGNAVLASHGDNVVIGVGSPSSGTIGTLSSI